MDELGRLQSMGLQRVGHDWATSLSLSCFGEGNGNPLQCSCLENSRDGGIGWASVYGVAQSRTWLKGLSSSSSSSMTHMHMPYGYVYIWLCMKNLAMLWVYIGHFAREFQISEKQNSTGWSRQINMIVTIIMTAMMVIMRMIDPTIVQLTHCQPYYIFYFILITLWDRYYNSTFTESKVSSVQLLSSVRLFATPWTTARQASLSITSSPSPPKPMYIESVMPSIHLILCRPLLLLLSIFPSIRVFSNESAFHIRWPKYWSFSFNISPSNEHPGLISFRMDWLDLLAVQGTLKSLLQHHSSKALILRHSAFFIV